MWNKPKLTAGAATGEKYDERPSKPTVVILEWDDRIYRVRIGDIWMLNFHLSGSWEGTLRTGIRIVGVE